MAIITRWSYKRGGRKAGFHCSLQGGIKLLCDSSGLMVCPIRIACFNY